MLIPMDESRLHDFPVAPGRMTQQHGKQSSPRTAASSNPSAGYSRNNDRLLLKKRCSTPVLTQLPVWATEFTTTQRTSDGGRCRDEMTKLRGSDTGRIRRRTHSFEYRCDLRAEFGVLKQRVTSVSTDIFPRSVNQSTTDPRRVISQVIGLRRGFNGSGDNGGPRTWRIQPNSEFPIPQPGLPGGVSVRAEGRDAPHNKYNRTLYWFVRDHHACEPQTGPSGKN